MEKDLGTYYVKVVFTNKNTACCFARGVKLVDRLFARVCGDSCLRIGGIFVPALPYPPVSTCLPPCRDPSNTGDTLRNSRGLTARVYNDETLFSPPSLF